jgi:hypothetical protein
MKREERLKLAKKLADLWDDLELTMGEMAAYAVACEQLNISQEKGWKLLNELEDTRK